MRPFGVTVLSILYFLSGLGALVVVVFFAFLIVALFSGQLLGGAPCVALGATLCFIATAVIGLIVILLLFNLILAWGLWTGRNWARIIVLALTALGLVLDLPSVFLIGPLALVGILFNLGIIYYLTRRHVVEFFTHEAPHRSRRQRTFAYD